MFNSKFEAQVARVIYPKLSNLIARYNNRRLVKRGSRYVNTTPCPYCSVFLQNNNDCRGCPLDERFGIDGTNISGCKVALVKLFGSFTFKDYPQLIVTSTPFNPQIERMNRWFRKIRGY